MNVKLLTQPKETVLLTLTSSLPSEAAPAAPAAAAEPRCHRVALSQRALPRQVALQVLRRGEVIREVTAV